MNEQRQGDVCYLQFEQYQQFPEIIHGIFTRLGGYSTTPSWGLNISTAASNNHDDALRNRLLVLQTLGIEIYPCATIWMVHGAEVTTLTTAEAWEDWHPDWPYRSFSLDQSGYPQGTLQWSSRPQRKADAMITQQRGIALAISVADCVPLLFYDPVQAAIGLTHAGWRGTARGIAAATIDALSEQFGSQAKDIRVGIGPAIGACCYEVSEQVQKLFHGQAEFTEVPTVPRYRNLVRESAVFSLEQRERSRRGTLATASHSGLYLDLWETNRNQLLLAGIVPKHIEVLNICTSCNTDRFFSHRGEQGKAGRFPIILALKP